MNRIRAVEEIAVGLILLYQWLMNRRMLRITEALRQRIESLENSWKLSQEYKDTPRF